MIARLIIIIIIIISPRDPAKTAAEVCFDGRIDDDTRSSLRALLSFNVEIEIFESVYLVSDFVDPIPNPLFSCFGLRWDQTQLKHRRVFHNL